MREVYMLGRKAGEKVYPGGRLPLNAGDLEALQRNWSHILKNGRPISFKQKLHWSVCLAFHDDSI